MTQEEANQFILSLLGRDSNDKENCSGNAQTCAVDECMVCSVRDCPGQEPLHYHHDGYPYCYFNVEGY